MTDFFADELERLRGVGNLRELPQAMHEGKEMVVDGRRMLNLSSNDYLGVGIDRAMREEFLATLTPQNLLLTSSSSRLLTGNYPVCGQVEDRLARMFGREAALVFNSGYHMNAGILPAVSDGDTVVLADKLVHASLIDGIRLSAGKCVRFRHGDYGQLQSLLQRYCPLAGRVIVAVESVYSMDGDVADLQCLVGLKHRYPGVMLYVDEAHAFGVYGRRGLGMAEEQGCMADIDLLCGTFGKALGSVGAYVVCDKVLRDFLVNKMRTLIFTTALPPLNWQWTAFVLERLEGMSGRRAHLAAVSAQLRRALAEKGIPCVSGSHIVPYLVGGSDEAVRLAGQMQRKGFYVLPVRPPTVPEGTSRLRFSLTAALTEADVACLIDNL